MISLCILILTSFLQHLQLLVTRALWDYGIEVAGKSKKCGKQTPTLEVRRYSFKERGGVAGCEGLPLYDMATISWVPVSSWRNGDQSASGHFALFLIIMGSHVVHCIDHMS